MAENPILRTIVGYTFLASISSKELAEDFPNENHYVSGMAGLIDGFFSTWCIKLITTLGEFIRKWNQRTLILLAYIFLFL